MFRATVLLSCLLLAAAAPAEESPLQTLEKHSEQFKTTFENQLKALASSENTQKVEKALKEGSDAILTQLSALSTSLQSAMTDASGKAKEALESTRTQIETQAKKLQQEHPEVKQRAEELQQKIQGTVSEVLKNMNSFAAEFKNNVEDTNKKMAPQVKAAYDDFVKQMEKITTKVSEAANAKH